MWCQLRSDGTQFDCWQPLPEAPDSPSGENTTPSRAKFRNSWLQLGLCRFDGGDTPLQGRVDTARGSGVHGAVEPMGKKEFRMSYSAPQ
jgi:hypothetical protein